MVLTPPPPTRALATLCYVLATAAGAGAALLLTRAAAGEEVTDETLMLAGLAGLALAFAMLLVGAAELARRSVLLWSAEGGKLVGQVVHTGEQVQVPVLGSARVERELRALSNGVHAEQYSVWVHSPLFGPVRMPAGGGRTADDVRQRWAAATFSGGGGEVPARPPPGSGVEVGGEGICRIPAGLGGFALPFLLAGLLVLSPVLAIMLMRSPVPWLPLVLIGAAAAAVALRVLVYAFSHWELRAEAGGTQVRRCVGPLSLGAWRRLPGGLRLDLSRAPRVVWVDGTGQPCLRAVAVLRGPTLVGVLWLTAVLRQHSREEGS